MMQEAFKSANPSLDCVTYNKAGFPFEQLWCLYPSLERWYFDWEKNYDPVDVRDWMVEQRILPIALIVGYGVFIVVGQNYYFKNREPWNMRKTLAFWNFTLSFFSFCGMMRTVPHLLHQLTTYSMRDNLCGDPESYYGSGSTGFWVQMFVLSKIPELLDTFFIVIHKKPLIFLHWYHHVTVLLYSWYSFVLKAPSGIFSTAMNYTVHFVMYGYYFLMAIKSKPKWLNAMIITVMQIAQMVVGVVVMLMTFYYINTTKEGEVCHVKPEMNLAAVLMYGSYLMLFLEFFLKKYFMVRTKKVEKKKGE